MLIPPYFLVIAQEGLLDIVLALDWEARIATVRTFN